MEIELKHLAGYLPYDTVVFINDCKHKNIKPIHKLHTVQGIGGVNHLLTSNRYRIVLHPLSDLTKEIEVNGEKFVPCEELLKIRFKQHYDSETISRYKEICYSSRIVWFQNIANYNMDIPNLYNILEQPYWVIQKLLEWHFDLFSLIDNNLAIDVNNIK